MLKYESDGNDLMNISKHSDAFFIDWPFIDPLQTTTKTNSQFVSFVGGRFGEIINDNP